MNVEGVLLVLVAIVILARLALYAYAEDWGTKAPVEGLLSNIVFGALAVVLLVAWAHAAWMAMQWLMIPNALTVLVALVLCASAISGGALLDGVMGVAPVHPGRVAVAAIAAVLFAASRWWTWLLRTVVAFLNDPAGTIKGRKK